METTSEVKSVEQMVEDNQRLVHFLLQRNFPYLAYDEDIQQIGMIGLWKACKAYDPEKSKFSTFAATCIVNEVRREIRNRNHSRSIDGDMVLSLESDVPNCEGYTLSDNLESTVDYIHDAEVRESYYQIANSLPERSQQILHLIQIGRTQVQIAKEVGISQAQVSRISKGIREQFKALL